MSKTTSRRAVLAGAAALAAVVLPTDARAGDDAELIRLGERFEKLLLQAVEADLAWRPLSMAAHAEVRELFKFKEWRELSKKDHQAATRSFNRITKRIGLDAASDRVTSLADEMNPLAESINDAPAISLAGLRAKTLVALSGALPTFVDDGCLEFPEDQWSSLFHAAAELTGLAPMVSIIESRLAMLVQS